METFLSYCYSDRLDAAELGTTALCACLKVAIYYGAQHLVHLCEIGLAAYLKPGGKRHTVLRGIPICGSQAFLPNPPISGLAIPVQC